MRQKDIPLGYVPFVKSTKKHTKKNDNEHSADVLYRITVVWAKIEIAFVILL